VSFIITFVWPDIFEAPNCPKLLPKIKVFIDRNKVECC
jgi:hypothetical protein